MKRISIYNEKGGSGKTTIGILLASYLAYVRKKRVCVLDFDYPTFHFDQVRQGEMDILKNPRSQLSIWLRDNDVPRPYEVYQVPTTDAGTYSYEALLNFIAGFREEDYDYMLLDFPGRFSEDEPVAMLAANGVIDFVAVPMDTDTQSRKSALIVCCALLESGVPNIAFWNRVTKCESNGNRERFRKGAQPFASYGIPVMEEMVREVKTFSRDSDELLFVRSTLCFPDRFMSRRCPSFFPFLEELVRYIDDSDETLNQKAQ